LPTKRFCSFKSRSNPLQGPTGNKQCGYSFSFKEPTSAFYGVRTQDGPITHQTIHPLHTLRRQRTSQTIC